MYSFRGLIQSTSSVVLVGTLSQQRLFACTLAAVSSCRLTLSLRILEMRRGQIQDDDPRVMCDVRFRFGPLSCPRGSFQRSQWLTPWALEFHHVILFSLTCRLGSIFPRFFFGTRNEKRKRKKIYNRGGHPRTHSAKKSNTTYCRLSLVCPFWEGILQSIKRGVGKIGIPG
jgi:hypothetical protein